MVDFNSIILEQVVPQLRTLGFVIIEKHKMPGLVQLQRDMLIVTFAYNELDYEKMFSLGTVDGRKYMLDDDLLQNVFHSGIKITNQSLERFVESARQFIQQHLHEVLLDHSGKMQEIALYTEHRHHAYWEKLLKDDLIQLLDNAWNEKRFADYVELFDNNLLFELPKSYALKRGIAGKKM